MRALCVGLLGLLALGCGGPEHVTFDHEQCLLDGNPANVEQVEQAQARIASHVLDRQPIYLIVTLAVILLAGASHIEKLFLLFSTRKTETKGMAERLRAALDRYRAHPVRYFTLVGVTLALLGVAGGLYLYLDADKRASERALGQLQFCHLALRTAAEQASLAEQRKNLDSLQATAGDIKSLVDQLPPEEQRKAELLFGQMKSALGNQDRMLARETVVAQAVQQRSDEIQKGLGALTVGLGGLKPLPDQLRELEGEVKKIDKEVVDRNKALDDKIGKIDCAGAKLSNGKTVGEALADLMSRPPPVCKCEVAPPPPPVIAHVVRDGGLPKNP